MLSDVSALFVLILTNSNAANILILSHMPSFSHHKWNSAIGESLAAKNHNVTILSPYLVKNPSIGVHFIFMEIAKNDDYTLHMNRASKIKRKRSIIMEFFDSAMLTRQMCSDAMNSVAFQQLLNYPDDMFDVIVYDFTGGQCLMPFVHKFKNAILVITTPFAYSPFLARIIGDHQHYSYVPYTVLPFNSNMTFWQRFINFLFHVIDHFGTKYVMLRELELIWSKYFDDLPPIEYLEKRTRLALVNTNPIIDNLGPQLPSVIGIAGIHVTDAKPLPNDLEQFINSSRKGTVLFSLGSCMRSDNLPIDIQEMFIKIFTELSDYNFLWKFETNLTFNELPKNVRIQSWIPQSDILTHPNIKALITHGGLLSSLESIWRGVPLIVIPFLMDQHANMHKMMRLQIAESLDFYSMTYENTKNTLLKILENPSYLANAKKLSDVVQDQTEKPIDRAVWWIEWLLRHPNIDSMQSPVQNLGFIIGNSYDVIAFSIFIIICFVIFFLKLLYFFCCKHVTRQISKRLEYYNRCEKHKKQS